MKTELLYAEIVNVLSSSVEARNDDKVLIFNICKNLKVPLSPSGELIISLERLGDLPSFESIRRLRQKIQNEEGRFIPTYGNVLCKRGFTQDLVRSVFGESSNEYQNYIFIKTEGSRFKQPIVLNSTP